MGLGAIAALSTIAWALHAHELIAKGSPWDLLWTCNLAPLVLAAGCLLRRPRAVAAGLCWTAYGTPMWLLDLFGGGELMLSSFASHLGVLALGGLAVRRLGWPRGSWLWAIGGASGVVALTRLVSPPALNVNLAFSVWSGWESLFPRHDVYFLVMWSGGALTFLIMEVLIRRGLARSPGPRQARGGEALDREAVR